MANKISTLILTVNLECSICTKMIKKAIGKLQDREKIQSVVYDEKKGIITISGQFDPDRLSKKLCCTACKVIKDIRVKPDDPPPKPAPAAPKPAPEPPKPALPPPEQPKPAPAPPPATPAPAPPKPTPAPPPAPEPEKPKPTPAKPEPQCAYPYPYPYPCPYPYPVAWPFGPACGCGCGCGSQTGWCHCKPTSEPPPPASSPIATYAPPSYCDGYRTCKFICEEEPSACSIM